MLALALSLVVAYQAPEVLNYMGQDVRARAVKSASGEWVEELYGKDAAGEWRLVLVTPTFSAIQMNADRNPVTALNRPGKGLFDRPPTLAFDQASMRPWVEDGKTVGSVMVLRRMDAEASLAKRVWIPRVGTLLRVEQTVEFPKPATPIRYFLSTYAFAPDGKAISQGGKPDSTFVPSIRPKDDQVIGDHQYRAPVITAQKGTLAALMMPDLDVLADNRPIPTIMDLDAANGVVDSTLMSYGFADHKVAGHVYFSHDAGMVRKVPKELRLAYDLIVTAKAEPYAAYREAVPFHWEKYGKKNFDKILPQVMPFADYAEYCYPRVFEEAYGTNKIGWFEVEIDGVMCGGIPSGWGFREGWVSWQAWFNQIRSAWGLRWWGKKLGNADWVDKADKMLNLALAAPMDRGAVPTTYQSREKTWKGSLITPSPDCYYDLTNMAWKGIWLLRFLEFEDCPRREEILRQCREMADCMMRVQNADGSFPTWLSKEHKVVPILDRSAQSALPAWFVAEIASANPSMKVAARASAIRCAEFLAQKVVDQQLWYDFETFFSCSPKTCLQAAMKIDDPAMHDRHSLSPPQNTLSMQWAAEALAAVARLDEDNPKSKIQNLKSLAALDIMTLYQNVWSIPWRPSAYTFGGFGVQNSDGEFLDARQSQFGCTLADFGVRLGRRDYFERGIAAVRASMTLINHPLHSENGLYPNPNYPPGLQPENVAHGGSDHQAGRTGFDWGEGSGLAGMAWLLHQADKSYRSYKSYREGNWEKLIDGGYEGQKHFPKVKALTDPTFDFNNWRMPGWTVQGNFPEVPTYSNRMNFGVPADEAFIGTCEDGRGGYDDAYQGTILSPYFLATKSKLKLLVGGGNGENVYVELLVFDANPPGGAKDPGKRIYVARGKQSERMEEVTWDLTLYRGKHLRLRIVDRETGGWGHINVGRVRVVD
ncbi:MAG TPA: hypothetical protein PLX06_04295 [Fimbriimonadaceae bacterium]|nr:hypothetical protein [Fimbriimonadaceae bacterium]